MRTPEPAICIYGAGSVGCYLGGRLLATGARLHFIGRPRIRDEVGQLQLVPPDERISGSGSTMVMAAFTHLNPEGSRFSDGRYGVYYAAHTLATAGALMVDASGSAAITATDLCACWWR